MRIGVFLIPNFRRSILLGSLALVCSSLPPMGVAQGFTALKFDFGAGPAKAGYIRVNPEVVYSDEVGYGYEPGAQVAIGDNGNTTTSDRPFFFSAKVPEGNFNVTLTFGDSSVATTMTVKAESGRLMLPQDFHGISAAAEVKVSSDGRFLYGTNRYEGKGQNGDIVVFAIDQKSGLLTQIQHISSGGETPRNFEFDPSGKWMLVTNHGSNNAVVFKIDRNSGKLTQQGEPVDVPYPFSPRFVTSR